MSVERCVKRCKCFVMNIECSVIMDEYPNTKIYLLTKINILGFKEYKVPKSQNLRIYLLHSHNPHLISHNLNNICSPFKSNNNN